MKNLIITDKKGFANIAIIILVIVLASVVGYFIFNKQAKIIAKPSFQIPQGPPNPTTSNPDTSGYTGIIATSTGGQVPDSKDDLVYKTINWDGLWKNYKDNQNNFSFTYPSIFIDSGKTVQENRDVAYYYKFNDGYTSSTTKISILKKALEEKETGTQSINIEIFPAKFYRIWGGVGGDPDCFFDKDRDDWVCIDYSGKEVDIDEMSKEPYAHTKRSTIGKNNGVSFNNATENDWAGAYYAVPFLDNNKILQISFEYTANAKYGVNYVVNIKNKDGIGYSDDDILSSIKFDE